jgi:hypothetical protein
VSLEKKTIHLPLAAGMDTKTDPRALEMPKLALLEGGQFEEPGGIQKRTGITSLGLTKAATGTIGRLRALSTLDGELLLFAEGHAWSWSDKESAWMDRWRYESVLVDQKAVAQDRSDQIRGDRAEVGDVVLYVWEDRSASKISWQCVDKETGAIFQSASATTVSGSYPRARAVGTKLHAYYFVAAATLKVIVIDPTDVYGTINSAPVTLSVALTSAEYDVEVEGASNAYVVYPVAAGYEIQRITETAAFHATPGSAVSKARASDGAVACGYNANASAIAVARIETAAGDDVVKLDWLNTSTLADVTVGNTVDTITAANEGFVQNITCPVVATTDAYVIYEIEDFSSTPDNDRVYRTVIDSAGAAGTVGVLCRHCGLGSRGVVWTDTDSSTERVFVHVLHDSTLQPTYALLDAEYVVGPASQAAAQRGDELGLIACVLRSTAQSSVYTLSHIPQLEDLGSNQLGAALVRRRRLNDDDGGTYGENGVVDFKYTLADPRAYRGVQEGRTLYLPGGYLAQYDGERVVESGILIYPEGATASPNDGAGALTAGGVYSYHFYWERINTHGERQISSYAGAVTATAAGANPEMVLVCPTNPFTNDSNLVLAVYRTEADPGPDAPYYRISSLDPTVTTLFKKNAINADTVTITDTLADSAITSLELDYQNPGINGTELDNIPPPATPIVSAGQARVWTVDPEDRTLIYHSKIRLIGDGVSFNEALTIKAPQPGGDVTAVEVTEGGCLIFKQRAIYIVQGLGPDNLGNNPYPQPTLISRGIGCADARSLVRIPPGVMFRSEKGFYLLDNGYQLQQLVAGPEDYDATTIAEAIDVAAQHQARFLLTGTGTLVYDYLIGEWAIWPPLLGTSMVWWSSSQVQLETSSIEQQVAAQYQDNSSGYSLVVETAWIKLAGIQDFGRLYKVQVLGEHIASNGSTAHSMRVRIAYDYTDTWIDDQTFTPSAARPIRDEIRVSSGYQKCTAFKVRIEDLAVTGDESNWKQGIKLTALSAVIGVKRGLARLPVAQRA